MLFCLYCMSPTYATERDAVQKRLFEATKTILMGLPIGAVVTVESETCPRPSASQDPDLVASGPSHIKGPKAFP